jgi:hypothetical protein
MVTVKKIEAAHLPEVNEALAKSLGIAEASVEGLRADIKKNLEREVKFRLQSRNKNAVMDALIANAELDLPNASVQSEINRMIEVGPRRAEVARHQGRRQRTDPRRSRPSPSRAPRAPGPGGGRAGACQQPAGQARADQGPCGRAGFQLREAGPTCSAGITATSSAWPKSKAWSSRTT